jgi:hypothetical protein
MLSVLLSCPFRIHLPAHLPSARFCYPRFSRLSPLQYYAGSDSCRASPVRQVSLLTPLCLPDIPSPTTSCARTSRACHLVRPVRPFRPRLRLHSCRLAALTPPNRVRHPAGCPFASGCFPPRLAATQLPSATCDGDFTRHGLSPCRQRVLTDAQEAGYCRPSQRLRPGRRRTRGHGSRRARVAALLTMRAERIKLFVQRRQSHRGTHSRATESRLSRLRSGYL